MFKNLTIGKKIIAGFSIVLILLIIVGITSFSSISDMGDEIKYTVKINEIIRQITAGHAAHLSWVNKITELLSNENVKELNVQTNDRKCTFGKWLYSEKRTNAEIMVPQIKPILKEMEGYHEKLHHSAIDIKEHFKQSDMEIPQILSAKITDHLIWSDSLLSNFIKKSDDVKVQTDPTKCGLGKWMISKQAKITYENSSDYYKKAWEEMDDFHKKIHETAIEIKGYMAFEKLNELSQKTKGIKKQFDSIAKEFTNTLEIAMETAIDPAKKSAEKSNNISEIVKWSNIDMVMNEKIIQLFLNIRLDLASNKEKINEQTYRKKFQELESNIKSWNNLVMGNVVMEKAVRNINNNITTWDKITNQLFEIQHEENLARASVHKAEKIYYDKTRPLLEKTINKLTELKKIASDELKGMKKANHIYCNTTQPILHEIEGLFEKAMEAVKQRVVAGNESILQTAHSTKYSISTLTIIAVIVGVFFAWIIALGIVRPIKTACTMLKDIAEGEGDLTSRLELKNNDELGELAKWFNIFVEKIQQIIKNVGQTTNTLASSSETINKISTELCQGAEDSSLKSNNVAAAAEEMSTNMNSVAASTEQASSNINMVASAAEEMTSTISEIAQNSEKARCVTGNAVKKSQNASVKINELGSSAREIGSVTETITDISEQTNLLALNATIEAARAGEAGKGFAVVANEIKELAKQTATATEQIKKQIDGIQNTTSSSVMEIEEISTVIKDVNEIVSSIAVAIEQQTVVTKDIASNVTQASGGIMEVAQNVSQATEVSKEVALNISDVNNSSVECLNGSRQLSNSAKELNELSVKLKKMVDQFKV